MTDLYKALGLSQDSTVDKLRDDLAVLLQQARHDLMIANDDAASDNAENKIILIREAQRQFSSQESKAEYDLALENSKQEVLGKKVREQSKYGKSDEGLLELLKAAVKKGDYPEVQSLNIEFQLRNCESAAYYRYLAEAQANHHKLQAAWDSACAIAEKYGDDGIEERAEACVKIAEVGIRNNCDLAIVRDALEYALEHDDYLRGQAEALDILWDLLRDNEALAIQKARATSALHPNWSGFRSGVATDLVDYAEKRYIKENEDMEHSYFEKKEDYESFLRILHLASDICPETDEKLRQHFNERVDIVEAMAKKRVIPGGWWAILFPIIIGVLVLVEPSLIMTTYTLIAIGIGFFFGLRIPKYMVYKYTAKGRLDGVQEIIRIISKIPEWLCKLFFGPIVWLIKRAA